MNMQGCTVIHSAAETGFLKGVKYILKLRSDAVYDTDKQVFSNY